jgi:hypothetical protein
VPPAQRCHCREDKADGKAKVAAVGGERSGLLARREAGSTQRERTMDMRA